MTDDEMFKKMGYPIPMTDDKQERSCKKPENEIDIVKRFVYDLCVKLEKEKVIPMGWSDTAEVLFDARIRKSLSKSIEDAKAGRISEWQPKEKVKE